MGEGERAGWTPAARTALPTHPPSCCTSACPPLTLRTTTQLATAVLTHGPGLYPLYRAQAAMKKVVSQHYPLVLSCNRHVFHVPSLQRE